MASTVCSIAPSARLGGRRVSIKAPSAVKAFGLARSKPVRAASQIKVYAYTITLKTPEGDQEIECGGEARAQNLIELQPLALQLTIVS